MMNLKVKLHPAFVGATIVVAFVGSGWIGFGPHTRSSEALAWQVDQVVERKMQNPWNTNVAVTPAIDAQQTADFETATFAVG